jgi:hypothetical protein
VDVYISPQLVCIIARHLELNFPALVYKSLYHLSMDISNSTHYITECEIDTPDGSFFIPSPGGGSDEGNSPKIKPNETSMYSNGSTQSNRIPYSLPVRVPSRRFREFLNLGMREYTGLTLKRFTIHQGRFGSVEDSSLLEAVVQSGFDDNKCIRICADGSESVHAFAEALSDEFLNTPDAVQLRQVTVVSPDEIDNDYFCVIEAVYPALPRFRHLARTYLGIARSDRSVLHASLSATCNMIGQILLTFQPEGYALPEQPPTTPSMTSPMVSTIEPNVVDEFAHVSMSLPHHISDIPGSKSPVNLNRRGTFRSLLQSVFICKR